MYELSRSMLDDFTPTGPTDPILYYRKPVVGYLYRERINRGLRLLGWRRYPRVLEVGYGSGAVQLVLSARASELHGIDLDADEHAVSAFLGRRDVTTELRRGSVLALPYPDAHFDLVVCFSVLEHLREYKNALTQVNRVLKPGAQFLLGMPAVNRAMTAGFQAIGFSGIDDHHVTTPQEVAEAFSETNFEIADQDHLGLGSSAAPKAAIYYNWLLEKRAG